jgi:hypothetical protein
MTWILLGILLLLVLVVAAVVADTADRAWWTAPSLTRRRRDRTPGMRLPTPRCLTCHGTGWVNREPERTFTFTGDGFEDKHSPATMCPDCGGTGTAPARRSRR